MTEPFLSLKFIQRASNDLENQPRTQFAFHLWIAFRLTNILSLSLKLCFLAFMFY